MGIAAGEAGILAELDPLERRAHRLAGGAAGTVGAQHVEDRLADAHRRVEGAARILRHVGHRLATQAAQRPPVAAEHALAADLDRPALDHDAGPGVPEQGERRRRLAATRLAHQADDLAGRDAEGDTVDDRLAGLELQAQVLDPDDGRGRDRAHSTTLRVVRGTYERPRLRAIASPVRLIPMVSMPIMAAGTSTDQGFSWM